MKSINFIAINNRCWPTSSIFHIEAAIAVISPCKCVSNLRVWCARLVSVSRWHCDDARTYGLILRYGGSVFGLWEHRGVIINILDKDVHIRRNISLQKNSQVCGEVWMENPPINIYFSKTGLGFISWIFKYGWFGQEVMSKPSKCHVVTNVRF